jgi:hypothetical protein
MGGVCGFAPAQSTVRREDCRDAELSPPTLYDPDSRIGMRVGRRRNWRCPTCLGYGYVAASGKDKLDPYLFPRKS